MTNRLGIEQATLLTISIAHLSPGTISEIERCEGDIPEGPSIAIRRHAFMMNSDHSQEDALEDDVTSGTYASLLQRHPDLVLVRALARGMNAEWICLDTDGVIYGDVLPVYDERITPPTGDGWSESLSTIQTSYWGDDVIIPSIEILRMIEAGQTPRLEAPAP